MWRLAPVKPAAPAEPVRPFPAAARWSAQLTPLRALWIWGPEAQALITDQPGARAALFDRAIPPVTPSSPPVTLAFIDDPFDLLFQPRPGAPYDLARMRNLLADLHAHGIEAHLVACGHPRWSSGRACLEKTLDQVLKFNLAGSGDTGWDGVQLATPPRQGEPWDPYVDPPQDPEFWKGFRADVRTGSKRLEGKLPFGVMVSGAWAGRPELGDLSLFRPVDYLAILPAELEPDRLVAQLKPWLELNVRFLVGIRVDEGPEVGPMPPGMWGADGGALESTLERAIEKLDLAAPLVGFGFADLEGYLRMRRDGATAARADVSSER
jgi:hypothetical protein